VKLQTDDATAAPTPTTFASAKYIMVWNSEPNNWATLNSHTDPSRCSLMLPDRLNAKRCALRSSETTSPVLLNTLEVVEQNQRISWTVYRCLRKASKSNHWDVQISELLGVFPTSLTVFWCTSNMEPYSLGVIIRMFISTSTIQLTIFFTPWFRHFNFNTQSSRYLNPHD